MNYDPESVPKPKCWADYVACYRANVEEATHKLEWARSRFRQLRDAGQITPRVEGGWICDGKVANQVLGDVVRWRSDLAHWTERLTEAEENQRKEEKTDGDKREVHTQGRPSDQGQEPGEGVVHWSESTSGEVPF